MAQEELENEDSLEAEEGEELHGEGEEGEHKEAAEGEAHAEGGEVVADAATGEEVDDERLALRERRRREKREKQAAARERVDSLRRWPAGFRLRVYRRCQRGAWR